MKDMNKTRNTYTTPRTEVVEIQGAPIMQLAILRGSSSAGKFDNASDIY